MNLKHAHRVGLKAPTDISGKKNPRYKHGLLIKVNEKKNCIVCGKEFIARLKHIQHCSRKCSSIKSIAAMNLKRISLKEQAKLEGYTGTVSNYRA